MAFQRSPKFAKTVHLFVLIIVACMGILAEGSVPQVAAAATAATTARGLRQVKRTTTSQSQPQKQRQTEGKLRQAAVPQDLAEDILKTKEEQQFWNRMLDEEMHSMMTMVQDETDAPSNCPVQVEVDCLSIEDGIPCWKLTASNSGGIGRECHVPVEYTYTITNQGDEDERIYSLVIARGNEVTVVTDIPDAIEETVLGPGESIAPTQTVKLDLCDQQHGESYSFSTKADVIVGPPTHVDVAIACITIEGEDCSEITPLVASNPDECLVDATYTYTLENTGPTGFDIMWLTRTRNGEAVDLMPMMEGKNTFLAPGESTSVKESDTINRCLDDAESTKTTTVELLPPVSLLCTNRYVYPDTATVRKIKLMEGSTPIKIVAGLTRQATAP